MKKYKMIETVQGSRDGIKVETFTKGETYELDESLAALFFHQGAVDEAPANAKASAPEGDEKTSGPITEGQGEAGIDPATMRIEELVALGRDTYGLDVNSRMSPKDVLAMIEAAKAKGDAPANKMKSAAPENKGKK